MTTATARKDELDVLARYSGDPWIPQNPYFKKAESPEAGYEQFWQQRIWPLIASSDFSHVVDLAAGHGRNSAKLLPQCRELTIVDIQPGNIEECKKRFGEQPHIHYLVNNGYDLAGIADGSITLVYCFDAMVHFDSDVIRSYIREFRRILTPGGMCFLHHSNYTGGHDWRTNPASRNFMSKELFAHYAMKENMEVLRQDIIDWGEHLRLDCLSLLRKPA